MTEEEKARDVLAASGLSEGAKAAGYRVWEGHNAWTKGVEHTITSPVLPAPVRAGPARHEAIRKAEELFAAEVARARIVLAAARDDEDRCSTCGAELNGDAWNGQCGSCVDAPNAPHVVAVADAFQVAVRIDAAEKIALQALEMIARATAAGEELIHRADSLELFSSPSWTPETARVERDSRAWAAGLIRLLGERLMTERPS